MGRGRATENERMPSWFAVGFDRSDGSVVWLVQDSMREISV